MSSIAAPDNFKLSPALVISLVTFSKDTPLFDKVAPSLLILTTRGPLDNGSKFILEQNLSVIYVGSAKLTKHLGLNYDLKS